MTKSTFYMPGLFLLALAAPALAQQPSPEEMVEALQLRVRVTQENLDQAYLGVGRLNKALVTSEANAKWVLDNWVPKSKLAPVK